MDDLVRREDVGLALLVKGQRSRRYRLGETWELNFTEIREALADVPSAQPEIIRCKDCKHGSPNGKYGCRVYHYRRYETHDMKPDDFCSRAERKQDE